MPPPGSYSHNVHPVRYRSPATPAEFAEYFSFRWELLRKPLALPRGSEQDELDNSAFHVAAYDEQHIVGAGRVHIESDHTARIRYMAVHPGYRCQGVGSCILRRLEQFAYDHHVQVCWLYARESAVSFYTRNGYVVRGQSESELSALRHERMEKRLA